MTDNPYVPADPGAIDWDVVIVGTGMGGATLGHELARLGQRVLFIEKGLLLQGKDADSAGVFRPRNADLNPEDPEARLRMGRWPLRLEGKTSFGGQDFFAPLGCGTGGSTTQYAAALERLWPADFKPRLRCIGRTHIQHKFLKESSVVARRPHDPHGKSPRGT